MLLDNCIRGLIANFTTVKILYINKNILLSEPIVKEMVSMGLDVDVLVDKVPVSSGRCFLYHRIANIFNRVVLKNKDYYTKLNVSLFNNYVRKRLSNKKKHYDVAFFIRADMYTEKLIKQIRSKTSVMINYQWDGIDAYPHILSRLQYFDKKFVFDRFDLKKYQHYDLKGITNFHYSEKKRCNLPEYDFFYVGVGLSDRIQIIKDLENFCESSGLKMRALLTISPFQNENNTANITYSDSSVSLLKNEELSLKSNAILDFKLSNHSGASFRVFECLKRNQKLISNNFDLVHYDFYHPNNIYLTDFSTFLGLEEFLNLPYTKIPDSIIGKYSIENWLRNILELPLYDTIGLP